MPRFAQGALAGMVFAALALGLVRAIRPPPSSGLNDAKFHRSATSRETDRSAKLDSTVHESVLQDSRRRIETKNDLARSVIRGEMTLSAAATQFDELNKPVLPHLRRIFPGVADEELHYRNVLLYVRGRLADVPESRSDVKCRLRAEFYANFPMSRLSCPLEDPAPSPPGRELRWLGLTPR